MKTTIKYILLSIFSSTLLATSAGCDSLLNVETKHALAQDKIKNEEGCESLIIG